MQPNRLIIQGLDKSAVLRFRGKSWRAVPAGSCKGSPSMSLRLVVEPKS